MLPEPIYRGHNLAPAYKLRYSWSAFPKRGAKLPDPPAGPALNELKESWKTDGLHHLEHHWTPDALQVTFSATPQISPTFLASRAKGRLQHAMRQAGTPLQFARNFAVRTLGDNTRETVERYVTEQVDRSDLADPRYRQQLKQSAWQDPHVNLQDPQSTASGRYWYNLHLVFVVADRYRMDAHSTAPKLRDTCMAVAKKHDYRISTISVMPDHLHMALGGNPAQPPEEIALHFQNNTAWAMGQRRFWEYNYYAGSVGEYTMAAVRSR